MAIPISPEQKAAIDEQKQYCPFCKIIKGEIPVQKVYEDSDFLAVLDINPAVPGHTLLLPKEHYPVLPFLPDKLQERLGIILPQLSTALQKAMVTRNVQTFIANGGAAGQQTSHFMVHLFPVDGPLFSVPDTANEKAAQMKAALAQRYADPKERLMGVLAQNQQLRRMIVETPEEFARQLPTAPDLARLFAGVDIAALAHKLAESEPPAAARMEDGALVTFINAKEKLREMLVSDLKTLEMAIETQPKLKLFFAGATPASIRLRYLKAIGASAEEIARGQPAEEPQPTSPPPAASAPPAHAAPPTPTPKPTEEKNNTDGGEETRSSLEEALEREGGAK